MEISLLNFVALIGVIQSLVRFRFYVYTKKRFYFGSTWHYVTWTVDFECTAFIPEIAKMFGYFLIHFHAMYIILKKCRQHFDTFEIGPFRSNV